MDSRGPHGHHVPVDSPPISDNYIYICLCRFCGSLEGSVTNYEQVACLLDSLRCAGLTLLICTIGIPVPFVRTAKGF